MDRPAALDPAIGLAAALAETNEMRRRGAGVEAKARALRAVAAFPHEAEAKALVGEICRDEGETEEAARWYGLALADDPACLVARRRLGIADAVPKRRVAWVALLAVAGIGLVLLAFKAGDERERSRPLDVIAAPRAASSDRPAPGDFSVPTEEPPRPTGAMTSEEVALFERLRSRGEAASGIVLLQRDPTSGTPTITLRIGPADPSRGVALAAARLAADVTGGGARVRVLRGGSLVFAGELGSADAPTWTSEWSADDPRPPASDPAAPGDAATDEPPAGSAENAPARGG